MTKLWANSGYSHFLEPEGLWHEILPTALADRMPRSERVGEDEEIVYVDGQSFPRRIPRILTRKDHNNEMTIEEWSERPPGARDVRARLTALEDEGIWAEVIYASLGLWEHLIKARNLINAATRA